jgi:hypothetical protein
VLGRTQLTKLDALPLALALTHGAVLLTWPSIPVVAVGLWWNANTISHQFIHRPFFRSRTLNGCFSCYLSLVLGFPQSLWRARHLAHHLAIEGRRERNVLKMAPFDFGVVIALWGVLLAQFPGFLLTVYLPGFVIGLAFCYLQGHYEHARGIVSHYGRLYNFLLFNDGYHIEHHARPAANWWQLPLHRTGYSNASRWPPLLRWLEVFNLCALERLVLRFRGLQRFVVHRHEGAFRRLLIEVPAVRCITIVGGGLFPRTALVLRQLLPEAKLILIDQSESNLAIARRFLAEFRERRHRGLPSHGSYEEPEFVNQRFDPEMPCEADLIVIPLAFEGDRQTVYQRPPAPAVVVHDWIWRRRGAGAVVSWLLLKRLNLVKR